MNKEDIQQLLIVLTLSVVCMVAGLLTINTQEPDAEAFVTNQEKKVARAKAAYYAEDYAEAVCVEPEEPKITNANLPDKLQEWIIGYCYERHLSPYIVMALIEKESGCNAYALGDDGESIGLMQIQPKWNKERMDRLKVTDLTDPYENIKIGVDILLELYHQNPNTEWVLMAYNGWTGYADRMTAAGKVSSYAINIMDRAAEMEVQ